MTYDPKIAIDCSQASLAAYDDLPYVDGYETTDIIEMGDSFAFICQNKDRAILAYRGTDDIMDLLDDLNYVKTDWHIGRVHKGFADSFLDIHMAVVKALDSRSYFVTGHSLGGAYATLDASFNKALAAYVFGSPRVGNSTFDVGVDLWRHEKFADPVTYWPPRTSPLQIGYALTHFRWPTLYKHKGEKVKVGGNLHTMKGYLLGPKT